MPVPQPISNKLRKFTDSQSLSPAIDTLLDEAKTPGEKATVKAFAVVNKKFDIMQQNQEIMAESHDRINASLYEINQELAPIKATVDRSSQKLDMILRSANDVADKKVELARAQAHKAGERAAYSKMRNRFIALIGTGATGIAVIIYKVIILVLDHMNPPPKVH